MDPLSDVVAAMRTGDPHASRVVHRAPFGRQLAAVDAAGFHVVLAGTCWFVPPDGDPTALRPGDIVFMPRGCSHALVDDPATPVNGVPALVADSAAETVLLCGAYLLDRSRSHPMLAGLSEVVHLPAPATRRTSIAAIVDLLDDEVAGTRPGRDAMVRGYLDALLVHILRSWLEREASAAAEDGRGNAATGWAAALNDPAVTAALSAIHGSPEQHWTVAELAARAGVSRASLARRFTGLLGQPPIAYLTWWRMTIAARRLRDTSTPLPIIARDAGYASEFAFSHAFKNEFGDPPARFRKQARPPEVSTN